MDTSFEQKVRERAYEIWMAAGQADGMAHEHWIEAEQSVKGEGRSVASAKKAAGASKASKKPAGKATGKGGSKTAIAKAAKAKPASEMRH